MTSEDIKHQLITNNWTDSELNTLRFWRVVNREGGGAGLSYLDGLSFFIVAELLLNSCSFGLCHCRKVTPFVQPLLKELRNTLTITLTMTLNITRAEHSPTDLSCPWIFLLSVFLTISTVAFSQPVSVVLTRTDDGLKNKLWLSQRQCHVLDRGGSFRNKLEIAKFVFKCSALIQYSCIVKSSEQHGGPFEDYDCHPSSRTPQKIP